jgi:hypothetical protein
MSKRGMPWLQFYPADWLSDSIAGCSLAAQGLWFRMLFVAHASQRYGHLEIDGKAIPDELLFRRCGCTTVEEYRSLLAELFAAGVPSRTTGGVIYSRRMVRDQEDRDSAAERQRRHRSHAPVTRMSREEVRSQKTEVREEKEEEPAPSALVPVGVWLEFVEMRKKIRRPMTPKAAELIHRKLAKLKSEGNDPVEVVEQSIRNSWQDVFAVKEERANAKPESFADRNVRRAQEELSELSRRAEQVLQEVGGDLPEPSDRGSGGRALPGSIKRSDSGAN